MCAFQFQQWLESLSFPSSLTSLGKIQFDCLKVLVDDFCVLLVCPLSLKSTSKLLSVVVSYYIVVSSQLLQEQRVRNVTFWDVNETGEAVLFLCMCVGGHWVGSALPLPEAQRSASLLMKALLMTLSLSQNVSGSCLVVPVKSEAYWNQRYVWGHIQYICMYLCVYHLYNWINRFKWASLA